MSSAPVPDRAPGPVRLGRRLLLTIGGAVLLGGCDHARQGTATWAPGQASMPGDSHTGTGPPTPSPSATASPSAVTAPWQPPTPVTPVPGVCPQVPGVVQRPGGPQHYLPCHGTDIALTIDDGPDPAYTPQILALLDRYRIAATFCMVGSRAAANPSLVARVADAGHHVANHTYTHPLNLPALTPAQIHDQIALTSDTLTRLTGGTRPGLFRAPGGNWSAAVLAACAASGLRPLDWSVDPRDWSQPGVQHIVQVILTQTRPGSIILDHDGGGNRQETVDALRIALPRLVDAGYTFTQP